MQLSLDSPPCNLLPPRYKPHFGHADVKTMIRDKTKKRAVTLLVLTLWNLSSPSLSAAAWLLWEHWITHSVPLPAQRDKDGMLKGFRRVSDSWSLENAFDNREQCIAGLLKHLEQVRETRLWGERDAKPSERTRMKIRDLSSR